MLEQVLTEIHNWFQVCIYRDEYTIQDGSITLPFLRDGQYFRIVGSVFNDGLHKYGHDMEALTDETFFGTVWALAVPKIAIDSANELEKIDAKIAEITADYAKQGFTSESFGGYAYQKDVLSQLNALNAQKAEIMKQLNPYRKLREV